MKEKTEKQERASIKPKSGFLERSIEAIPLNQTDREENKKEENINYWYQLMKIHSKYLEWKKSHQRRV